MAKWFFSEKGVNDKERDPGWDEYFSSNRSTVESLVRESIQNSLDAAAKKGSPQALVRIYSSGEKSALSEADYAEYLEIAKDHYSSPDCGLEKVSGTCPFFVIEDFHTDGLVDDILADNESEPYFKFLKCENKSTKDEPGSLGKWGIGKVVFPIASRIRTFFAYSIREEADEGPTRPNEILVGECLLKYHTAADGKRYTPDGWWGAEQVSCGRNKGKNTPLTDCHSDDVARFRERFHITRYGECGLSVVIPFVEHVDIEELRRSIIENYMAALVDGKLRVEVRDGDGHEYVYDRDHTDDIADFLSKLATAQNADNDTKQLVDVFQMILEARGIPEDQIRRLAVYSGTVPSWQNEQFDEVVTAAIKEDLARREDGSLSPSVIEVPILISKKKVHEKSVSTFRVVLKRCESSSQKVKPLFFRNGLFISHVGANSINGYIAVALLDGPVGDMMNEAEPPSHTQWFANTGKFKKDFNYPEQIIDYVKRAPRQIVHRVDIAQDADDFKALQDYFSISRSVRLDGLKGTNDNGTGATDGPTAGGKGRRRRKKRKNKPDPNRPTPTPPLPKPYILEQYVDEDLGVSCFRVVADPEKFRAFMFTASLAYPTLSGKVVYDENDFSLKRGGDIKVYADGVTVRFPTPNQIEALVPADRPDFVIEVKGFDIDRDLDIDDHYRAPEKWNEVKAEVKDG